ncbi:MAG: indolepyruvate oxidoreductase subunit beta [Candidatus Aenigmatarchaeota archaeon]
MKFNCVISGIGGQGVITLANILEEAALIEGYEVAGSELHGLAMRFGPLECHVRFGKNIYSPLVKRGEANLIFSLEPLEALRVAHFSNEKTIFLVNKKIIKPISVYVEGYEYPSIDEIEKKLKNFTKNLIFIDASEKVKKFGEVYSNVYMLGFSLKFLPISKKSFLKALKNFPNFEINKIVLEMGEKHEI